MESPDSDRLLQHGRQVVGQGASCCEWAVLAFTEPSERIMCAISLPRNRRYGIWNAPSYLQQYALNANDAAYLDVFHTQKCSQIVFGFATSP